MLDLLQSTGFVLLALVVGLHTGLHWRWWRRLNRLKATTDTLEANVVNLNKHVIILSEVVASGPEPADEGW